MQPKLAQTKLIGVPDRTAAGDLSNNQQAQLPAAQLSIANLTLSSPVVLAPMAGVTNSAFRRLCRRYGGGLFVSEMVTARAIVEGNTKSFARAYFDVDEPIKSVQLYGVDPATLGEATRILLDKGADHIDLNFGCPVPKVTRRGGGAALTAKPLLIGKIIEAVVSAANGYRSRVPVTVKFRMGVHKGDRHHLRTGKIAVEAGAAAVALHARTAEDFYSGSADRSAIAELADSIDQVPVLGNGDIFEAHDALSMMQQTGCDGVVIGRGCLGRPWLFRELDTALGGGEPEEAPTLGTVTKVMSEHFEMLCQLLGTEKALRDFRKHCGWYLTGYSVGGEVRRQLNQLDSREQFESILSSLDPAVAVRNEGLRAKRAHGGGPRRVALPEGWSDDPSEIPCLEDQLTGGSGG